MRNKTLTKTMAFLTAMVVGTLAVSSGIQSAEAKDYYTRKRVNGKWVTGKFPKRQSAKQEEAASPKAEETAPVAIKVEGQDEPISNPILLAALQKKAAYLAAGGVIGAASITYDYDQGIKTTFYKDGSIVEDAIDETAPKGSGVVTVPGDSK